MCGLVGVCNLTGESFVEVELLERMTRSLAHRGPDEEGFHIEGPIGLGHRRLSIIDLASGQQPMLDRTRDRAIVYNGEIYNYREIREQLQRRGDRFQTNCDTEVLLKAAELDTALWLNSFNGMWAFAIWHAKERTLQIGRDRLGIKPLYWTIANRRLIFASEIKAILLHPEVRRQARIDRIAEFLAYRTLGAEETLLEGIQALAPGHVMTIRVGDEQPAFTRYWDDFSVPNGDYFGSSGNYEEQLQAGLDSAVRYRLISEVPLGTYNSGGVDSSLVTAAVRRMTQGELHTFSVGFPESSHDESAYAQMVAKNLGTYHHALRFSATEYARELPATIWHCEEPLSHAHTVPLLVLSRFAKQYVTVVLTGEGADELFGGYPRYQIPMIARSVTRLPKFLRAALHAGLVRSRSRRLAKLAQGRGDVAVSAIENARFVSEEQIRSLGLDSGPAQRSRAMLWGKTGRVNEDTLERVLAFDRATYLPTLLRRLDRTTMASGVEARVPFLDFRLLSWSKRLPTGQKILIGRENKILLKRTATRVFPRSMIYRRKMGFDVPISEWLRRQEGLAPYLDCLLDQTFRQRGFYVARAVETMVDDHARGERDHGETLWPLLMLELWLRLFVDHEPVKPA